MSAAAAEAPAPAKGKKKLIIIIVAAVLVLAAGGVGGLLLMKKNAAADHADEDGAPARAGADAQAPAKAATRRDPKALPVFVPLDPFTVNLADRDAERYAQVGITLEIDDAKTGDLIKTYMPAIRNNILMSISERTAGELMDREGKTRLAGKIMRETSRALGYDVEDEEEDPEEEAPRPGKKKKRPAPQALPVLAVHFSNFIIQ